MIHLIRQKKGYAVANVAKNGELLKISETLSSKQKCYGNILSEAEECYFKAVVYVQDDTLKQPKITKLIKDGDSWWHENPNRKPVPKYQPGKNTSKKK